MHSVKWRTILSQDDTLSYQVLASSLSVLSLTNYKSLFFFSFVCLFVFCFIFVQADMQPESSGCNEVKYNLNVDTIEAIFKTYPAGNFSCILRLFFYIFLLFLLPIWTRDITYNFICERNVV